ncbi:MAG: hypothetical protein M1822_005100 [Bathelium mastoideum]|nr:MAG: hypothetical protein M1822_005100 [Bathelium mastoideum]
MDHSPRSAKRRKLDHNTSNSLRTPRKREALPATKSTSRQRSTRANKSRSDPKEQPVEAETVQTGAGSLRKFSDAVAEYRYDKTQSAQNRDENGEKSQVEVEGNVGDSALETPSRRTRHKLANSQTTSKSSPAQSSASKSLLQDEHLRPKDSSAQIIAKDGIISGLGNGVNGSLSTSSSPTTRQQHNRSQSHDGVIYQDREQADIEESEQPRSGARQRRKSQKVLDQEADQRTPRKKRAPKTQVTTKSTTKRTNSDQFGEPHREQPNQVNINNQHAVTTAQNEHQEELSAKPSPKSIKQQKTSSKRVNRELQDTKIADTKHEVNHEDVDPVSSHNEQVAIQDAQVPFEDGILAQQPAQDSALRFHHPESLDIDLPDISQDIRAPESAPSISTRASTSQLDLLQHILTERITCHRPIPLTNLADEYAKVHNLISQTVTAGEGNSMLLVGARGSGKTALVNAVISDLLRDHKDDFHIIRLNGFIQTDDKLALREIWRQLGREMEVEDEGEGTSKNYADTLATLLALLSHPSEIAGQETDAVAKAVVFIMDEFDLFALHPRQTLLYNLFDIAQSRKAPIAVLGLTTRLDVTEALEKRVKSRWSHRYVYVPMAKSLVAFKQMVRAALVVDSEQLSFEERTVLMGSVDETTPTNKKKRKGQTGEPPQDILPAWNSGIDVSFSSIEFLNPNINILPHSSSSPTPPSQLTSPAPTPSLNPFPCF